MRFAIRTQFWITCCGLLNLPALDKGPARLWRAQLLVGRRLDIRNPDFLSIHPVRTAWASRRPAASDSMLRILLPHRSNSVPSIIREVSAWLRTLDDVLDPVPSALRILQSFQSFRDKVANLRTVGDRNISDAQFEGHIVGFVEELRHLRRELRELLKDSSEYKMVIDSLKRAGSLNPRSRPEGLVNPNKV